MSRSMRRVASTSRDRGNSHQVKVFTADGKLVRSIGIAGAPSIGDYEPAAPEQPERPRHRLPGPLWVAEDDSSPQRVSVWAAKGELLRAFYGPTEYGGGGVLDSRDASVFFYKGTGVRARLEDGHGQARCASIPGPIPCSKRHYGPYSPDTRCIRASAKAAATSPVATRTIPWPADNAAFIWLDDGEAARARRGEQAMRIRGRFCAAKPSAPSGPKARSPRRTIPQPDKHAFFLWSDTNADGVPQPDEVQMTKDNARGITVTSDLAFLVSRLGDGHRLVPAASSSTRKACRTTDLKPARLGPAGGHPPSSGGNQTLLCRGDSGPSHTNAPAAFLAFGLGGSFQGEPRWSYPSPWPGLHASHEAAVPDRPGMVVGHTRLLGDCIQGKVGPVFCINGNMGNMYLFTADGLFVSTLFHDIRLQPNWAAPVAVRNMDVTDVSLHDENFWPSITQTPTARSSSSTAAAPASCASMDSTRCSACPIRRSPSPPRISTSPATGSPARKSHASSSAAAACSRSPLRSRLRPSMAAPTTGPPTPSGPSSTAAAPRPTSTATRGPTKSAPPSHGHEHASLRRLAHDREEPAQQQR